MSKGRQGLFWVVTILLGCVFPSQSNAQPSNAWINFGQTYYKIPTAKNGIYKLSYADLQAAGVPLGSIDPRRINLFHRGVEQAIFIQGQNDATFDPTDYIEFYGVKNDGTLDTDLYSQSSYQPHKYYNLFNDTTAYFLTWNPAPVAGKRMSSFFELNNSGLVKEAYHNEEQLRVYISDYAGGFTQLGEIQATTFDQGEGWTGPTICTNLSGCTGVQDLVVNNLIRSVASGSPQLEIVLTGRSEIRHDIEVWAGPDAGSLRFLTSPSFFAFETPKLTLPLNFSDIGAGGSLTVRVRLLTSAVDQISVASARVTFAQNFDVSSLTEKVFNLPPNSGNKSYVEILNPPVGVRIWDITDHNNVGTIGSVNLSGGIGAVVPETINGRRLYLASSTLSTTLTKVSFRPLSPRDFVIISHRSLMKPALGYANPVQEYAAYRASSAGGGYDTLVVTIDQLYNQFNYGEVSPRAIFQFMKSITSNGHPRYLFLIGKGLEVSQGFYRKTAFTSTDFRDLVPSAGMPGADMAFTAGLAGTSYEPGVPTGRITASTPVQVASYLNKVKEAESTPFNDLWRKDLLHLSGGINAGEPALFRGYVDGFKAVAEDYFLGGSAQTISKQTLNVELINVKDQVNKGLNLITFFGHSGPGTIDIDIGYVSDPTLGYSNAGKYPGFLINGCNAGRFFDNRVTFGEDWMLAANKGAKSFIAHSSFGFVNTLKVYSDTFYSVAFGDSTYLRKGVGDVQKEAGRRVLLQLGNDISAITQVQQMVLLGDPAVSLFGASKPDYMVGSSSVAINSLDGKPVTAQSTSFALDIVVKNFGRAQPGNLAVKVVRTLSDNSKVVYDSVFAAVRYSDVLRFVIRKGRNNNEFGTNSFAVTLDPAGMIPELDESNNGASVNFFIPLNGTKNLFPAPYGIVNASNVNLVFQHTDLLSGSRTFKIEIDTAATFDSPFLKRQNITGKVIAKTNLSLFADDSLVYYWRTKIDKPTAGESVDWVTSSFVHIKNSPEGWAQSKFPQLNDDPVIGLSKNEVLNRLEFLETVSTIELKTYGSANPTPYTQVSLKINGDEMNVATQEAPCRNNSINLIAFDKSSTAPYAGIPFTSFFDPRACGRAPQMINNFLSSEVETGAGNDLMQYIDNVQTGDSVIIYSIGDAGVASWSANVKAKLGQLGIATTDLGNLQMGEPFVIFSKKGAAAGTAKILHATQSPANQQELDVNRTITGRFTSGKLNSVTIGPALKWSQVTSGLGATSANDLAEIDVTGIDQNGVETLLKTHVNGTTDLSDIDAVSYPFLKLNLNVSDPVDLTPVQLRKWFVYFTPSPEGMLTYSGATSTQALQEGESWSAQYGFTNISSKTFSDSLSVSVEVFSTLQRTTSHQAFKIKPPAPGDTSKFSFQVNTLGKAGLNDVSVFVNPRKLPEAYYDNNVLILYQHLNVQADQTGPLLDVTVDGRHLVNGDAVSSSPVISVSVIDHNPFLFRQDTTGVNLFIKAPCATANCTYQRISFKSREVVWKVAPSSGDFQMIYNPGSLDPGEYALRAEAVDASGNASGEEPYEVKFVVAEKNTFTFQTVSPNPSGENFQFKFFISGPSSPENFSLQIYSSTGSLMKNYGAGNADLIHVGLNEMAINSNDEGGMPLTNGVYVFRMSLTIGGRQFTKSGRLVVLR